MTTHTEKYTCSWGKLHQKNERCKCESETHKRMKEEQERIQREKDNRPLTQEEQKISNENFRRAEEMGILNYPDSMFRCRFEKGGKEGRMIRRSTILSWQKKNNNKQPNTTGLLIDEDVL